MNKFAFLIHPLDMKDVIRAEPKAAGKREALVEKIIEWMPPYKTSHITGLVSIRGVESEGYFIVVPLMPKQFLTLDRKQVYKKIIDGGKIAEGLGAKILGLGGFTSVVGDAGITISKNLNIAVTSGNSYTIATAISATIKAAECLKINLSSARCTVIGATGSIGSVCAQIMADKVLSLTLVSRNLHKLKKISELIYYKTKKRAKISSDIALGIKDADIIISATSSMGGIIRPEHIKKGTLICDIALPHDVSREVASKRPDILVIEGGLVEVPGDINFNYNFGYPSKIALACMAETMILSLERKHENFSLGRGIKIEKVKEIMKLGEKHGFKLAGFRSFDRIVTREKINEVLKYKDGSGSPVYNYNMERQN